MSTNVLLSLDVVHSEENEYGSLALLLSQRYDSFIYKVSEQTNKNHFLYQLQPFKPLLKICHAGRMVMSPVEPYY